MLEEHRKSGPRTKAKGKWLEQTIAETMVSMSEDLYDTDDNEAPFTIKKLLRRPSRESKVPDAPHLEQIASGADESYRQGLSPSLLQSWPHFLYMSACVCGSEATR